MIFSLFRASLVSGFASDQIWCFPSGFWFFDNGSCQQSYRWLKSGCGGRGDPESLVCRLGRAGGSNQDRWSNSARNSRPMCLRLAFHAICLYPTGFPMADRFPAHRRAVARVVRGVDPRELAVVSRPIFMAPRRKYVVDRTTTSAGSHLLKIGPRSHFNKVISTRSKAAASPIQSPPAPAAEILEHDFSRDVQLAALMILLLH